MAKQPAEQGPVSGFRDHLAEDMIPRQEMTTTIMGVYEGYGFMPLSTPAVERLSTLIGKYGEEGNKLLYRVESTGMEGKEEQRDAVSLLALRYDLTVPLARVVAQHRSEISLPYKRYQVDNVWRGESPQAGRYREFMQFDADTIGTKSAIADAEIVAMMSDSMQALGADTLIRVNNRKILDALADKAGIGDEEQKMRLFGTIDKMEKIGKGPMLAEIESRFHTNTAQLVQAYLDVSGTVPERIQSIEALLGNTSTVQEGTENLQAVFKILNGAGYHESAVTFDQTIARGLDYYTGIIYETNLKQLPRLGSVCSGGRYDNLVKALGGPDLPAVGTSIGVDRLLTGLKELKLVSTAKTPSEVMVINFTAEDAPQYMQLAKELRTNDIPTEIHYDGGKIGKQIKQAEVRGIPYVVFLGENELQTNSVKIKNLQSGEEVMLPRDQLPQFIQEKKLQG